MARKNASGQAGTSRDRLETHFRLFEQANPGEKEAAIRRLQALRIFTFCCSGGVPRYLAPPVSLRRSRANFEARRSIGRAWTLHKSRCNHALLSHNGPVKRLLRQPFVGFCPRRTVRPRSTRTKQSWKTRPAERSGLPHRSSRFPLRADA